MSQAGIINVIDNNPTIPIYFEADTGFAVALFNVIRILGDGISITTSASGNTINIDFSGNVFLGLTPDAGGQVTPTAGNIDVFGQKTVNAQSMMTNKVGSNFMIEDRTWVTAYVVDPSTAAGTRGTFSTIQSAITQIIADGIATSSRFGLVKIRAGTYNENITMTGIQRIYLQGMIPEPWNQTGQPNVFINGTLTFSSGQLFMENVGVIGNTTISSGKIVCYNSFINGISGTVAALTSLSMYGGELRDFNVTGLNVSLKNVDLSYQTVFTMTNCTVAMVGCAWISSTSQPLTLAGTTSGSFSGCQQMYISGSTTGNVSVDGTSLQLPVNLGSSGNVYHAANIRANLINPVIGGAQQDLYTLSNNNRLMGSLQGNVILIKKIATDYNVLNTDYYIGITSTAAARTMTLPALGATGPKLGQTFVFKDESGGAATNNITISPTGATIDGAASAVINVNYGSLKICFDGTNYFII